MNWIYKVKRKFIYILNKWKWSDLCNRFQHSRPARRLSFYGKVPISLGARELRFEKSSIVLGVILGIWKVWKWSLGLGFWGGMGRVGNEEKRWPFECECLGKGVKAEAPCGCMDCPVRRGDDNKVWEKITLNERCLVLNGNTIGVVKGMGKGNHQKFSYKLQTRNLSVELEGIFFFFFVS